MAVVRSTTRRLARQLALTICKTFGHSWDPGTHTDYQPRKRVPGSRVDLLCVRCESWRIDWINAATGELIKRYYDYCADWKSVGVKLTRPEMRRAYLRRQRARATRRKAA